MRTEQYLGWDDPHEDICIHHGILCERPQFIALDVTQLSSHDPQVGHSLWGFLALQVLHQFVEVAGNFPHKILGNLW